MNKRIFILCCDDDVDVDVDVSAIVTTYRRLGIEIISWFLFSGAVFFLNWKSFLKVYKLNPKLPLIVEL